MSLINQNKYNMKKLLRLFPLLWLCACVLRRCIITPLKANNDTLMDIYNVCIRCYATV